MLFQHTPQHVDCESQKAHGYSSHGHGDHRVPRRQTNADVSGKLTLWLYADGDRTCDNWRLSGNALLAMRNDLCDWLWDWQARHFLLLLE